MSKYIDVESLGIGRANPEVFENRAYADGWNSAIDIILSAPTADVQEIKHGKWLPYRFGLGVMKCSICGAVYDGGDSFRFCPKCGTKMDLEDDK